jgi:poly-gamma-glutamate synthesis protein (capsule biosynthesis protein)
MLAAGTTACERPAEASSSPAPTPAPSKDARAVELPLHALAEEVRGALSRLAAAEPPTPAPSPRASLTLIAGGDVSFGRLIGQILLREPERELFSTVAPLLKTADIRFCNLESQLSDQRGQTVHPLNNLVFTGPPAGADALARAGFTVVSTANNHAWDYGKKALFETMDNLDRVGVRFVGTGRNRREAYQPVMLEHNGLRLAMLAVTDIWNQGSLWTHPGREFVAGADFQALEVAIKALRADPTIDFIALSYHGLAEYIDEPMQRTREILRHAIDSGADLVIGHHPHVVQGVEWRRGKPILYSLGNLLMRMNSRVPWTEMGYLARVKLTRGEAPTVEACPFRMHGITPLRFVGEPSRAAFERRFFGHLAGISKAVGGTTVGATGEDGCAPLSPPAPRAPRPPKKPISP